MFLTKINTLTFSLQKLFVTYLNSVNEKKGLHNTIPFPERLIRIIPFPAQLLKQLFL